MENLFQFRVHEARGLAADRGRNAHGGVIERVAKRVSTDHSGCANDDKALWGSYWNSHHDNGRSSIQSTFSRRSEKSQASAIFANVSR